MLWLSECEFVHLFHTETSCHVEWGWVFLSTSWMDSDSLTLHTDASGTLGYGGILGNKWFQGQWETHQQLNAPGISIAWQGLFALVVACHIWMDEFANKRIVFYCDNASVVSIVNSKTIPYSQGYGFSPTPDPPNLKAYLLPKGERHIEGKKNDIADSLSRFQMDRFCSLAPDADPAPCPVPQALLVIWTQISRFRRADSCKKQKNAFLKNIRIHVDGALKRLHKSVKNFVEHKASYQLCVSRYDPGSGCPLSISHPLYKNYPRISEYFKK